MRDLLGQRLTDLDTQIADLRALRRTIAQLQADAINAEPESCSAEVAIYLVFLRKQPVRDLGVWIIAIVLLTLGLAVSVLYTPAGALVPVLNSYWLVIHVAAAITAGGVFTLGAVATALYLVRLRAETANRRSTPAIALHRPPAQCSHPGQDRPHRPPVRLPLLDLRRDRRRHLGIELLGPLLGLGPEGDLGLHHLGALRRLPTRPSHRRLARPEGRLVRPRGLPCVPFNFFGVNMWITGLHSYAGI